MNAATVILGMSLLGQLGFDQPGGIVGTGYEHRGAIEIACDGWLDTSQKFGRRSVRAELLAGKRVKTFVPVAGVGVGTILGVKTGLRFVGGAAISGKGHRVTALWLSPDSVNFSQSSGLSLRYRYGWIEVRVARLWFNGTSGNAFQGFLRIPILER